MSQIFSDAKFGDMFLTDKNEQAVFLRFLHDYKFVIVYVEGKGQRVVWEPTGDFLYLRGRIVKRKETK